MSTRYGYHCKTCPQQDLPDPDDPKNATSEHWINHGDAILLSFAKLRRHVKAIMDGDTMGYLMMEVMGYGSAPFDWLREHAEHDIQIEDEYGRRYSLEAAEEIQRLQAEYARIGRCYMMENGVYCPRFRSPDSAAGLCGRCGHRQEIRDRIEALANA